MAIYTYARPSDGMKIRVKGDSPPGKEQLDALFRQADDIRPEISPSQMPPADPGGIPEAPSAPPLPFGMTWEGVAKDLPAGDYLLASTGERPMSPSAPPLEGGRDVVAPTYPEVTTERGFKAAREMPGRVVEFEKGELVDQPPPLPTTAMGVQAFGVQDPGPVPTSEEAAALAAAVPAMASGAAIEAGKMAVEAPYVLAREAGAPPIWPFEEVWERRDEEQQLAEQEEARLREDLGEEWSEAIAEDAEAIAGIAEVLGHAVNSAMEEAKNRGEDPVTAVADLGFRGGKEMVKAFDRDLRLLASNPIDYARAYPATTLLMALPALSPAAKGAKAGTVSLVNKAKQSPRISRMMEKSNNLLVKAHDWLSVQRAARRHGISPEELRQAERARAQAPPRPKTPAPEVQTESPQAPPRRAPMDDLTSQRYDVVDEELARRGLDPVDRGPSIPNEVQYAGLYSGEKLTEEAASAWNSLRDRWLKGDLETLTPREHAVVGTVQRDAINRANDAADMSVDIVAGRNPRYPKGSQEAADKLLELNQASSSAEATYAEVAGVSAVGVSNAGRVLRMQQDLMTRTFDILHMRKVATMKKGSDLTPKETDKLSMLSRKARESQEKMNEAMAALSKLREKSAGMTGKDAAKADRAMERLSDQAFRHAEDLAKSMEGWAALKHSLEKGTAWGALSDYSTMILHGPKMLRAIWDASGATVQAGFSGLGHPVLMAKAASKYVPGLGQAWTKRGAWSTARGLMDSPAWDTAIKSGLPLYDMGGAAGAITGLSAADDMFAQGVLTHMVNKSPVLGAWVNPSARVHAAFLNSYRLNLFNTILGIDLPPAGQMGAMQKLVSPFRRNYLSKVNDIKRKLEGTTGKKRAELLDELKRAKEEADELAKSAARYVGSATGHATSLPAAMGGEAGLFSAGLNTLFWSKRMFISAFEHPARASVWTYKRMRDVGKDLGWADAAIHDAAKRAQIAFAADSARSAVGMGAVLFGLEQAGWEVIYNPFSPDFGRARKGDMVVDLGGFQMVLMRAATSMIRGNDSSIEIGRYVRKKASPTLSLTYDMLRGKDYMGAPVDVVTALGSLAVPLSAENFLKAMHSGEVLDNPLYTTGKLLGGKMWMEGDDRAPLSEIAPYSYLPYAGDMQLELPEWITDPEELD